MKKNIISIAMTTVVITAATMQTAFSKDEQNLDLRVKELEKKFEMLSHKSKLATALNNAKFFGRLQVDANWYNEKQATVNKSNGIDIARARIGVEGKISDNLSYKFENDFSENASDIKDAFIAYTGLKNSTITFGQTKPTFSLEMLESSNHMTFIQRAAVSDDAVLPRKMGIKGDKRGKGWRIAAGIFGESVGSESRADDSQYSFTARASTAPINNSDVLLHLGIASSFTSRNRNTNSTTHDTLDKERLFGAELIARYKAFTLQSEYIMNDTKYDGDAGTGETVSLPGYYVQASVFLTGEQREYLTKAAKLEKINVKRNIDNGGIGAVELAARFSELDRNDGAIMEGKSTNYTLGVNWYPNNNLHFMLNYLKSETDFAASKNSQAHDAASLRMRFYF